MVGRKATGWRPQHGSCSLPSYQSKGHSDPRGPWAWPTGGPIRFRLQEKLADPRRGGDVPNKLLPLQTPVWIRFSQWGRGGERRTGHPDSIPRVYLSVRGGEQRVPGGCGGCLTPCALPAAGAKVRSQGMRGYQATLVLRRWRNGQQIQFPVQPHSHIRSLLPGADAPSSLLGPYCFESGRLLDRHGSGQLGGA